MRLFSTSLLKELLLVTALFATPALADCVTTCTDSDSGVDPSHAGSVEILTRCKEGDGASSPEMRDLFPDQCAGTRALMEYSCNRTMPGQETVAVTRIACADDCATDEDGRASCTKVDPPTNCMKPICPPPPHYCKRGPPKVVNGCPVDCGLLICDPNPNDPNDGNDGNNGKKPRKGKD